MTEQELLDRMAISLKLAGVYAKVDEYDPGANLEVGRGGDGAIGMWLRVTERSVVPAFSPTRKVRTNPELARMLAAARAIHKQLVKEAP